MKTLKEIAKMSSGHQGRVSEGNDFKQIKLKDVTRDGIINYEELTTFSSEKVNEKYLLKKNDIIIKSKSGDNTAAIIDKDIENTVATAHFIVIRVIDENIIDPEYLTMYLNSEYAQDYFKKYSEGTVIPIIKLKTLESLPIKMVSIEKQRELAKIYRLLNEEKVVMQKLIEAREKQFRQHLKGELEKGGEDNE